MTDPGPGILRQATLADIPAITAMIDASVRALAPGYYTPEQIDESLVSVFGVDTQLVHDGTYFVIEADGGIAAAGGWSRRATLYGGDQHKSHADALLDPATEPARIRAFFVAPQWARRGLARRLYQRCEAAALADGFRRFALGATLPGVPLYESLGFQAVARDDATMRFGITLPIVRMERAIGTSR